MNLFDDPQARQEVQHLHRLAMDAHREGQYATMERLLEQAVATAGRLDDLPYWHQLKGHSTVPRASN